LGVLGFSISAFFGKTNGYMASPISLTGELYYKTGKKANGTES